MRRLARFVGVLLLTAIPGLAVGQGAAPAVPATASPPPQVGELLRLLDEPSVKTWLETQRPPAAAPAASTSAAPSTPVAPAASPAPASGVSKAEAQIASMSDRLGQRMDELEHHVEDVVEAIPTLPAELGNAWVRFQTELRGLGLLKIVSLVAAFTLLGFGLEWLFWRLTARLRIAAAERRAETLGHRLRSIGMRLAVGVASVAVFGLGSIGVFLIFSWPPVVRSVVLAYLVALVITRLVLAVGRVLLVPRPYEAEHPDRHRVIPTSTETAQFWDRRILVLIAYTVVCLATLDLLPMLGVSPNARLAAGHLLGIGLLVIAIEIVWRRPRPAAAAAHDRHRAMAMKALLTAYILLLGALWLVGAVGMLALGLVVLFLPVALRITESAVRHLLRPEAAVPAPIELAAAAAADPAAPVDPVAAQAAVAAAAAAQAASDKQAAADGVLGVLIERGVRVLIILAAVLLLAWAWKVDLVEMTRGGETPVMRAGRAALSIVVILLLADLFWQLLKALIDRTLAGGVSAAPGSEAAIRQARLRTLLPILRNIAVVVIAAMAVLMVLSQVGVEIGPLIAGAGVVGVAVGFGAQTVVKDIISGIFYLLDDAFRTGEYIQSGKYQGTVESFSLRSVRLRAPRGPVFTIPFGELGAIENLSRDWAVDKFQIGVTYDTDLEKARKLIRKIGEQMKADPEYGSSIIEPLKMQGVQEFGTFAIQIRLKMTTKPGEQTTIRRKAYAQIKKVFDENGINFAFPTVQVAGGTEAAKPAVASHVLDMMQKQKQAEEAQAAGG